MLSLLIVYFSRRDWELFIYVAEAAVGTTGILCVILDEAKLVGLLDLAAENTLCVLLYITSAGGAC